MKYLIIISLLLSFHCFGQFVQDDLDFLVYQKQDSIKINLGIRSIVTEKFELDNLYKPFQRSTKKYDEKGNMTYSLDERSTRSSEVNYLYTANYKLKKSFSTHGKGNPNLAHRLSFMSGTQDPIKYSSTIYTYDDQNRVSIIESKDNIGTEKVRYSYTDSTTTISTSKGNGEKIYDKQIVKKKKLKTIALQRFDSNFSNKQILKYDDDKKILQSSFYGNEALVSTSITYFESRSKIQKKTEQSQRTDLTKRKPRVRMISSEMNYTYDKNGFLIQRETYEGDSLKEVIEFTYDTNGLLIIMTTKSRGYDICKRFRYTDSE